MSSYHHKSGAQKRKERADHKNKIEIAQRGQTTLTRFNFCPKVDATESGSQEHDDTNEIPGRNLCDTTSPLSVDAIGSYGSLSEATSSSTRQISSTVNTAGKIGFQDHGETCESPMEDVCDSDGTARKIDDVFDIDGSFPEHESENQSSEIHSSENLYDFDIGTVETEFLLPQLVENVIRRGHVKMALTFPRDRNNDTFPVSQLFKKLPNGEKVQRDWLVWSRSKSALFCLPCRLFSTKTVSRSYLSVPNGYSKNLAWKKLYDRLPSHESNDDHIQCYVKWRGLEARIRSNSSIDKLVSDEIKSEAKKWKEVGINSHFGYNFVLG